MQNTSDQDLWAVVSARFEQSMSVPEAFFTAQAAKIAQVLATENAGVIFAHHLKTLARPQDIALGFSPHGNCSNVVTALEVAKALGLLTLGLTGGDGGMLKLSGPDFCFVVQSLDPLAIQETHETLYHVLWELVHVFFEHEGLLQ